MDDAAPLAALLEQQPWVQAIESVDSEGTRLRIRTQDPRAAHRGLAGLLDRAGCGLVRLGSTRHGLEEVFLRVVGETSPGRPEASGAETGGTRRGADHE